MQKHCATRGNQNAAQQATSGEAAEEQITDQYEVTARSMAVASKSMMRPPVVGGATVWSPREDSARQPGGLVITNQSRKELARTRISRLLDSWGVPC
jgi:hypothetical protein